MSRHKEPQKRHLIACLSARLLNEAYFFIPYTAIFGLSIGLSITQLLLVESIYTLLLVITDIPFGHLSDKIGPKYSVIIASLIQGFSLVITGLFPNPLVFVAMQPLMALGLALCMGADSAFQRTLTEQIFKTDMFERWEEIFQTYRLLITALTFAVASLLVLVSPALTFIASGAAMILAGLIFFSVPTINDEQPTGDPSEQLSLIKRISSIYIRIRSNKKLGRDLLMMILMGSVYSIAMYLMPLYYLRSSIPETWIGALSAMVLLLSAPLVHMLFRFHTSTRWLLIITAIATSLLLPKFILFTVVAAVFIEATQSGVMPKFRRRVISEMGDLGETTALSLVTTARSLGFALLAPLMGISVSAVGLSGFAIICTLLCISSLLIMSKHMH